MNNYLTQKQVEILIKLYYLRKYTTAVEIFGIRASQIKTIEEHALRYIRLAYSKSYMQGKRFDGETVLCHMAERLGITTEKLSDIFDSYMS